jgi:hypothetical protein
MIPTFHAFSIHGQSSKIVWSEFYLIFSVTLTILVDVDNASFGVGGMAAISTLVGDLLSREAVRNDVGLVNNILGWGPDGLPWLSLGVWGHFKGDESCLDR